MDCYLRRLKQELVRAGAVAGGKEGFSALMGTWPLPGSGEPGRAQARARAIKARQEMRGRGLAGRR